MAFHSQKAAPRPRLNFSPRKRPNPDERPGNTNGNVIAANGTALPVPIPPGRRDPPVDFYLRDLKSVIEIDVPHWQSPQHFPGRPEADARKVKRLEALGFKVLQLKESEVGKGMAKKMINRWTRMARLRQFAGAIAGDATKQIAVMLAVAAADEMIRRARRPKNGEPPSGTADGSPPENPDTPPSGSPPGA